MISIALNPKMGGIRGRDGHAEGGFVSPGLLLVLSMNPREAPLTARSRRETKPDPAKQIEIGGAVNEQSGRREPRQLQFASHRRANICLRVDRHFVRGDGSIPNG